MLAITTRESKGAALTTVELDSNFTGLAAASTATDNVVTALVQSLPAQIADAAFMAAIIYG